MPPLCRNNVGLLGIFLLLIGLTLAFHYSFSSRTQTEPRSGVLAELIESSKHLHLKVDRQAEALRSIRDELERQSKRRDALPALTPAPETAAPKTESPPSAPICVNASEAVACDSKKSFEECTQGLDITGIEALPFWKSMQIACWAKVDAVCNDIRNVGSYEGDLAAKIAKLLGSFTQRNVPPPVLYDIGGNVGSISVRIAGLGYKTHVFEMFPKNQKMIGISSCMNGLGSKLKLYRGGLSEKTSECWLVAGTERLEGNAQINCERKVYPNDVRVPVRRLDDVMMVEPTLSAEAASGAPAVMKIDVEGHELPIIRGAPLFMSNKNAAPKAVFSEIWRNKDVKGYAALMFHHGYVGYGPLSQSEPNRVWLRSLEHVDAFERRMTGVDELVWIRSEEVDHVARVLDFPIRDPVTVSRPLAECTSDPSFTTLPLWDATLRVATTKDTAKRFRSTPIEQDLMRFVNQVLMYLTSSVPNAGIGAFIQVGDTAFPSLGMVAAHKGYFATLLDVPTVAGVDETKCINGFEHFDVVNSNGQTFDALSKQSPVVQRLAEERHPALMVLDVSDKVAFLRGAKERLETDYAVPYILMRLTRDDDLESIFSALPNYGFHLRFAGGQALVAATDEFWFNKAEDMAKAKEKMEAGKSYFGLWVKNVETHMFVGLSRAVFFELLPWQLEPS